VHCHSTIIASTSTPRQDPALRGHSGTLAQPTDRPPDSASCDSPPPCSDGEVDGADCDGEQRYAYDQVQPRGLGAERRRPDHTIWAAIRRAVPPVDCGMDLTPSEGRG